MAKTVTLRALTVRQPWAWAIIHGGKDIENRSWNTKHRGPLVIHAGMGFDRDDETLRRVRKLSKRSLPDEFDRGMLIGVVDVVDSVDMHRSPWFVGDYGFVLENPRAFKKPIPCKGRLSYFDVEIPDSVLKSAIPIRVR